MAIKVTHSGTTYDCAVAVKCTDDKYIKLYDANGAEIVSFNGISDFSQYTISGGSFVAPCDCAMPIPLSPYALGGRTITTNDWSYSSADGYYYEIASDLISANATTCNVILLFAQGTELAYTARQEAGKIKIITGSTAPLYNVVIEGIQILRV